MLTAPDLRDTILAAWGTNNRVTVFLVEHLPSPLWGASVPGAPRRTVRMIAGHIHNARCMWIKMVGKEHGISVPDKVDRKRVSRKELVSALKRSSLGINGLLRLGWALRRQYSDPLDVRLAQPPPGRRPPSYLFRRA